jgi:hypothetical protein
VLAIWRPELIETPRDVSLGGGGRGLIQRVKLGDLDDHRAGDLQDRVLVAEVAQAMLQHIGVRILSRGHIGYEPMWEFSFEEDDLHRFVNDDAEHHQCGRLCTWRDIRSLS